MKSAVQKAAGGVALGWAPLDFIFALCLPFFLVEHTSLVHVLDKTWWKSYLLQKKVIFRDIHGATDLFWMEVEPSIPLFSKEKYRLVLILVSDW